MKVVNWLAIDLSKEDIQKTCQNLDKIDSLNVFITWIQLVSATKLVVER